MSHGGRYSNLPPEADQTFWSFQGIRKGSWCSKSLFANSGVASALKEHMLAPFPPPPGTLCTGDCLISRVCKCLFSEQFLDGFRHQSQAISIQAQKALDYRTEQFEVYFNWRLRIMLGKE